MSETRLSLKSISELRAHIHKALCLKENLLEDQHVMREEVLFTNGDPCAMQFVIRGPRSIKLGAIWAAAQGTIYFYDTKGERYDKALLDPAYQIEIPVAEAVA
ncbi:MAG: hypothetical protein R3C18_07865 [Planctomycetaceae bacterium]